MGGEGEGGRGVKPGRKKKRKQFFGRGEKPWKGQGVEGRKWNAFLMKMYESGNVSARGGGLALWRK